MPADTKQEKEKKEKSSRSKRKKFGRNKNHPKPNGVCFEEVNTYTKYYDNEREEGRSYYRAERRDYRYNLNSLNRSDYTGRPNDYHRFQDNVYQAYSYNNGSYNYPGTHQNSYRNNYSRYSDRPYYEEQCYFYEDHVNYASGFEYETQFPNGAFSNQAVYN